MAVQVQNDIVVLTVRQVIVASRLRVVDVDCEAQRYDLHRGTRATIVAVDGQQVTAEMPNGRRTRIYADMVRDDWAGDWVSEDCYLRGVPGWVKRADGRRAKQAARGPSQPKPEPDDAPAAICPICGTPGCWRCPMGL